MTQHHTGGDNLTPAAGGGNPVYTNDTVQIPLQYYQHLHQIASMMLPTLTAQQQTGSALTPTSPQSNTAAVTAAQSPAVTVSAASTATARGV